LNNVKKYKPLLDSLGLEFLHPIFTYPPVTHFEQPYTIETVYDSITKKVNYRTPPPPTKKEIKPPFEGGFVVIKKEGVFTSNPICVELDALRKSKSVSRAYQVINADNDNINLFFCGFLLEYGLFDITFFGLSNGGVSPADAKKIAAEYGLEVTQSYIINKKPYLMDYFYNENGAYDYIHFTVKTPAWLYIHTFNQINQISKLQTICSIRFSVNKVTPNSQ
jgi:hypothetical protein